MRIPISTQLGLECSRRLLSARPELQTVFRSRPEKWGAVLVLGDQSVTGETERRLEEIPSETTLCERRFLRTFFATLWSGRGSVLEVGPFLGGTTRAIALGMLANPGRDAEARLFTYDRFRWYLTREALQSLLRPLVQRGLLSPEDVDGIGADGEFASVFERLHGGTDYTSLIRVEHQALPESLEDERRATGWLQAPEHMLSALFVDGCKAWYATKYFMKAMTGAVPPGAFAVFQDYGWYTCFWVSAFIESFSDYFDLVAYVDATYVFQWRRALTPKIIDERFPDRPEDLSVKEHSRLFQGLSEKARARGDRRMMVIHRIHLAGALAYLGDTRAAVATMDDLLKTWWIVDYEDMARLARRSPTYRPNGLGGEPILLPEP
jgi:hypothetical protein